MKALNTRTSRPSRPSYNPRASWPPTSSRNIAPPGSSFVDESSQMKVVVLENVSMVFHERFETESDNFSDYEYSVDAPTYLVETPEKTPFGRLNSTDRAANSNISRYFRVQDKNNNGDEKRDDYDDFYNDDISLIEESEILGSLEQMLPSKPQTQPYREPAETRLGIKDHNDYTKMLLGIEGDDDTSGTASMDSSRNEPVYESPTKKKGGWFRFPKRKAAEHKTYPLQTYNNLAQAMKEQITVQDRLGNMHKTYRQCFLGSDAVDFIQKYLGLESREEAVLVGREMNAKLCCFEHVSKVKKLKDKDFFFRFKDFPAPQKAPLRRTVTAERRGSF